MASVEHLWSPPKNDAALTGKSAHVWSVELDQPESRINELIQCLSDDERQRANDFKIEEKKRHFIVARANLRLLLGSYLNAEPAAFEFSYSSRGKPELSGTFAGSLHFNVSHSSNLALIAITQAGPVGVDLERVRVAKYDVDIARRFFTARESEVLQSLPESERPIAFFNLWTRKEAWLKATGTGISEYLNRAEMTFLPNEPAGIVNVEGLPDEGREWTLVALQPANGFVGALAVRSRGLNVDCWCRVE